MHQWCLFSQTSKKSSRQWWNCDRKWAVKAPCQSVFPFILQCCMNSSSCLMHCCCSSLFTKKDARTTRRQLLSKDTPSFAKRCVHWERAGRYRQQLWLEKLSITSGSALARMAFLPYFNTWFRSHCQGKHRCLQLTEVHTTLEPFAVPLLSVPTGTKHQFWPKVPPIDTRIYRI